MNTYTLRNPRVRTTIEWTEAGALAELAVELDGDTMIFAVELNAYRPTGRVNLYSIACPNWHTVRATLTESIPLPEGEEEAEYVRGRFVDDLLHSLREVVEVRRGRYTTESDHV